jgi:hypothetical protein
VMAAQEDWHSAQRTRLGKSGTDCLRANRNAEWAKLIDVTLADRPIEDVTPPKDDTGNDTAK